MWFTLGKNLLELSRGILIIRKQFLLCVVHDINIWHKSMVTSCISNGCMGSCCYDSDVILECV